MTPAAVPAAAATRWPPVEPTVSPTRPASRRCAGGSPRTPRCWPGCAVAARRSGKQPGRARAGRQRHRRPGCRDARCLRHRGRHRLLLHRAPGPGRLSRHRDPSGVGAPARPDDRLRAASGRGSRGRAGLRCRGRVRRAQRGGRRRRHPGPVHPRQGRAAAGVRDQHRPVRGGRVEHRPGSDQRAGRPGVRRHRGVAARHLAGAAHRRHDARGRRGGPAPVRAHPRPRPRQRPGPARRRAVGVPHRHRPCPSPAGRSAAGPGWHRPAGGLATRAAPDSGRRRRGVRSLAAPVSSVRRHPARRCSRTRQGTLRAA
jgi:hypothetical protein